MHKNKDSFWSLLKSDMMWLFIILISFFRLFYNYYLICCPMSKCNYLDFIYLSLSIWFPKAVLGAYVKA